MFPNLDVPIPIAVILPPKIPENLFRIARLISAFCSVDSTVKPKEAINDRSSIINAFLNSL